MCMAESYFYKKMFFTSKIGKWTKNMQKTGFFELKKLVINFSSVWSLMKVCTIGYIPAQIPYL